MLTQHYTTPGVYIHDRAVPPGHELRTGIPLFIGYAADGRAHGPVAVGSWEEFRAIFGNPAPDRYLAYAVRGFFANGGFLCHVCSIDRELPVSGAVDLLLERVGREELAREADLLCMPDIQLFPSQVPGVQQKILDFCRTAAAVHGRYIFALLDSTKGAAVTEVIGQRQGLAGNDAALYYPWIRVADGPAASGGCVPPCGHVAGICARSDRLYGVHKAPANEVVEEAIDLELVLNDREQGFLNPENVNCLRSFPGRGIRVFGARTVSSEDSWQYVSARRLFLSVCREIEKRMAKMLFEPHNPSLWMRISRELGGYLAELHRRGAFRGDKAEEAWYVKCDHETNSPETRDQGKVVVEIGLALAAPAEFIIVRIVQSDGAIGIAAGSAAHSPAPRASGKGGVPEIVIAGICQDPPGPDLSGECVTLRNSGSGAVEMTGWVLSDLAGHRFSFPRFTLHAGAEVRVWTREGEDTLSDLYWNHRAPLWNNRGDIAYLHDTASNRIATFAYQPERRSTT